MYTLEQVKEHSDDRDYVLNAIREDGLLLEGASEILRNDKEIVMEAVSKDGGALEFASD